MLPPAYYLSYHEAQLHYLDLHTLRAAVLLYHRTIIPFSPKPLPAASHKRINK